MQQSKRERIILLGVVPVMSAGVGALLTVLLQKYIGGAPESDVALAIIKMPGVSIADKQKLLQLANSSADQFYSAMRFALGALAAPLAFILFSIVSKIGR